MQLALYAFVLLMMSFQAGYAQDEPVFEDTIFTFSISGDDFPTRMAFSQAAWSGDGRWFWFTHYASGFGREGAIGDPVTFGYQVAQNLLQDFPLEPVQSVFSAEQMTLFDAALSTTWLSPNGRYVVYSTSRQVCGTEIGCGNGIGLADVLTGTSIFIDKPVDAGHYVRWSEDESAFLVIDAGFYGGVGGVWYVQVPSSFQDEDMLPADLLANYPLGSPAFVDISTNGEQVFVRGIEDGVLRGLYRWSVQMPNSPSQFSAFSNGQHLFENEVISGASFIPNDEQHILAITEQGIIRCNVETDEREVINASVHAGNVYWGFFSPDVRYVAVYTITDIENGGGQINIVPVETAS